jgi:hypothetical protein
MAGQVVEDACQCVLNMDGPAWEHKLRIRMLRASTKLAYDRTGGASEPSTASLPRSP